jgi:uncharacterized Zn finger protein (UPF0148 family)
MQITEVSALNKRWGDKPCDHPHFKKEYYYSMHTGDYYCYVCGHTVWEANYNKIMKERAEQKVKE